MAIDSAYGSSSCRNSQMKRGWKLRYVDFPPGTSKWNKIEHRLFSAITENWRGKPLVSHEVVVNLLGATTTTTGLKVRSELDTNGSPAGRKVSDDELAVIHLPVQTRFTGTGTTRSSRVPSSSK